MKSDKFTTQVYKAIDNNDLQLIQALLGPRYCQLWRYWLMHSIFSYDVTVIAQTLNHQLPLNIVIAQSQVLAKFFAQESKQEQIDRINIGRINSELKNVETAVLSNYKSSNYVVGDSNVISMRHMFDPTSKSYYDYEVDKVNENAYNSSPVAGVIEKFKDDVSLQHLLALDLSRNYSELYNEMYDGICKKYRLELSSESDITKVREKLEITQKDLTNSYRKVKGVINNISYIINQIKDKKFAEEIHNHLLSNIENRKTNNPSLSKEEIVAITKGGYDCKLLNKFMEYAVSQGAKPNIDIISLLIINGASLLHSYVPDLNSDESITKSITVAQYFTNNLRGEYATIVNKSIFTLMHGIHKKLFDFSVPGDNVDLIDIISSIPSKDGNFSKDIKDIYIFKNGQQGAQEFMYLLQNTVDKYVHGKASSSSKDMWVKRIYKWMFGGNNNAVTDEEYQDACNKLYDSIRIGYLALITCDDTVIVDYVKEIESELRNAKNPMIKELYSDFLGLLEEYHDLPKSMLLYRVYRYTWRTVKSYTLEWYPAWEKILKKPSSYCTDVGEWSKKKFDEIQETEQKLVSDKCIQLEKEGKQSKEKELKAQEKAEQAEEQARQEAAERQKAEEQARQEAAERQKAEEQARQAEEQARQAEEQARQEAAERQKAEEHVRQANKRLEVMCALSAKVSELKGGEVRAAVNKSTNKILEAVLKSNFPVKEALDMIMDQITRNKKQIINI